MNNARQVLAKTPLPCSQPLQAAASPVAIAAQAMATTPSLWEAAAAAELVRRCPRVLELAYRTESAMLSPLWLHHLFVTMGRAQRVLEIGASALAGWLGLFGDEHRRTSNHAVSVTTISADPALLALRRSEAVAGSALQLCVSHWSELSLGGASGFLPDFAALPNGASFDLVIVSPQAWGGTQPVAALVLPAIGHLLALDGFSVHLQGISAADQHNATAQWRQVVPQLELRCGDFGGSVLSIASTTSATSS